MTARIDGDAHARRAVRRAAPPPPDPGLPQAPARELDRGARARERGDRRRAGDARRPCASSRPSARRTASTTATSSAAGREPPRRDARGPRREPALARGRPRRSPCGTAAVLLIGAPARAGRRADARATCCSSWPTCTQLYEPLRDVGNKVAGIQKSLVERRPRLRAARQAPDVVERPGAVAIARGAGRGPVRGRGVRLRRGAPAPLRRVARRAGGRAGRHRGPERLGQDDASSPCSRASTTRPPGASCSTASTCATRA